MADLEGAEAGICTATGMSAIFMAVVHLAECGDEFVSGNRVYGGTFHLFGETLKKFGINARLVKDITNPKKWESLITPKTKFIYAETPGNPTNEIIDIAELSKVAHKHGLPLIIDNTICTPALQNPIDLGADIVVHSLTKYICGFGTTLGGIILGKKDFVNKVRMEGFRDIGPSMQAFDAWMILQGLQTLSMRMERHSQNAIVVANFLEEHPKVAKVNYVGLKSHPQHKLAKKQMRGASSLFSFDLKGDIAEDIFFYRGPDVVGVRNGFQCQRTIHQSFSSSGAAALFPHNLALISSISSVTSGRSGGGPGPSPTGAAAGSASGASSRRLGSSSATTNLRPGKSRRLTQQLMSTMVVERWHGLRTKSSLLICQPEATPVRL